MTTDSPHEDGGPGVAFAQALAAKDAGGMIALLAPDIDFAAITPGQYWESRDARSLIDETFFGEWLEPRDVVTSIVSVTTSSIGPREHAFYRLALTNPDGEFEVEQHAYFDVVDGRIAWLRILCSGYQRVAD